MSLTGCAFNFALQSGNCETDWIFEHGPLSKSKHQGPPGMIDLARDLDRLERHIEEFGSVTAKAPDVWGQARLTKYREEFEKEMEPLKDKFQETIQGSMARSDQAFFASALALSAAAGGKVAVATQPSPPLGDSPFGAERVLVPEAKIDDPAPQFRDLVRRTDDAQAKAYRPFLGAQPKFAAGLEPTLYLDQKDRYLKHLAEIRRINEGDDTADSPGYSLNLLRIPVSLLPGRKTTKGFGAEITFTLTPVLSDDLLPTTFRNLVQNDVVDQISVPLALFLNNHKDDARDYFEQDLYDPPIQVALEDSVAQIAEKIRSMPESRLVRLMQTNRGKHVMRQQRMNAGNMDRVAFAAGYASDMVRQRALAVELVDEDAAKKARFERELGGRLRTINIPADKIRRARLPFPPSQIIEVYGIEYTYRIAFRAFQAFRKQFECGYVHLHDVQSYLNEELNAAYKLLSIDGNADLWNACSQALAAAVLGRDRAAVDRLRGEYQSALKQRIGVDAASSTTAALAWTILVDSALLNEHLLADIRQTAGCRHLPCANQGWMPFYGPNPPAEARQAFHDYVRCRWPIHVFALDPAVQDQNIADSYASRRELQLSMALAFVTGNMNAKAMTRFARRLESEMDTIALVRTAVGFSHGGDTFGWRFYPRFQTPETEGHLKTFFRDALIGGPSRDQLLKQRQLEPGPRECVAVVLMPSFVPTLSLDASSNWFALTNPKKKEFDHEATVRLSGLVRSLDECAAKVHDPGGFREGELPRLVRRTEQLAKRLPLQTLPVQVPHENTLGGFEMFNNGVSDLAPQLLGWYGEPGIHADKDTTLFLVGDHFSVHQTRLIAGGVEIDAKANVELLSRQVMKVRLPQAAALTCEAGEVVLHLATPYGVSPSLRVPIARPANAALPTMQAPVAPNIQAPGAPDMRPVPNSPSNNANPPQIMPQTIPPGESSPVPPPRSNLPPISMKPTVGPSNSGPRDPKTTAAKPPKALERQLR